MQIAMDRMIERLRSCRHFDRLQALGAEMDACLVGGAVRDALVGHSITDIDLISPDDPTPLAKAFARRIGGHWFWLDPMRLQSRVVVNQDPDSPSYDFARFRAPSLAEDLLDRDFTINALALPLTGTLDASNLIDPSRGLTDLQKSLLRMVAPAAFANDPLRVVKGVRHATVLGLEFEPETLQSMRDAVAGLDGVAKERIRLEIWKVLSDQHAARGLLLLIESGAGEQLFGEGVAGLYRQLADRLEQCRAQWVRLAAGQPVVSQWLDQEIEQGLSGAALLTFAFLMAAVDRELPERLAEQWKLSRRARATVAAVAALDQSLLNEFAAIARTPRAFAWWAARRRCDPQLLLLALAGSPDAGALLPGIHDWVPLVAGLDGERPHDLVDGHWLRSTLPLAEGPEMNRALELLRNAEITGEVGSREDACRFLARHYQNRD